MKIKIDSLDKLFSRIIRLLANGRCQRCLKPTDFNRLQCCHFISRSNKKVRWDLDNAIACDYGCHSYLDSRCQEKIEFFKKLLGETRFEKLGQRANWPSKKIDRAMIENFLRLYLSRLENKYGTPANN